MRTCWLVLALLAACSFDSGGALPGPATSRDDAASEPADAAPDARVADAAAPDATPLACTGDDDCATPPSLCQLPGSCDADTRTCVYAAVDCAAVDDECNAGVCDELTAACVPEARGEGQPCGAVTECGSFGECGSFDPLDPCDETGQKTRQCADFACRAGTCEGTSRQDAQPCERDRDGVSCGAGEVCEPVSPCGGFDDVCDETGQQPRTCQVSACAARACVTTTRNDLVNCTRPSTDGSVCGLDVCERFSDCGGFPSVCHETGKRTRECARSRCADQACTGQVFVQTESCSEDTDGRVCGHFDDQRCTGTGECPERCIGACVPTCRLAVCADGECPGDAPARCP